ncbi:GFA family protein [Jiella sp. M17.18]|uniref:GFA family protein n=1 Tax=Jiella sp. M17.18 TaxID=3234247 RepID=UPI0034DDF86B
MAIRTLQAKCLCGGVRIDADFEDVAVNACHCDTCRRWTSGPFLSLHGAENVVLAGTDLLTVYKSSQWGERGFCKACGSALFWRSHDEAIYAISAAAVDNLGDVEMTREIFIDSKPDWYAFANDTEKMTGAEFFAMVAPTQEEPNG